MEDYKKMWFQLKKQLLLPPSVTSKEAILQDMVRIEIGEFIPKPEQVVIPVETKRNGKFFKR